MEPLNKPPVTADDFIDSTGMSTQPEQQLPATASNQEETKKITDFKNLVTEKQKIIERNSGVAPSFSEAQQLVLEEMQNEKAKEEELQKQIADQQKLEQAKSAQKLNEQLNKYENSKQFAIQNNVPFQPDSQLESALESRNKQLELEKPATALDELKAKTPTVADVQSAAEPIRKQNAIATAQQELKKEKINSIVAANEALSKKLEREDVELKAINPNRFWENKTTGQKILAGIAMALGSLGATYSKSTGPTAADIILGFINQDIEAQKLDNQNALAKRKAAMDNVILNIKKQQAATDNKLKQMQMDQLIQSFELKKEEIQKERLLAARQASGQGLTREEIFGLPAERQKKMIRISNDDYREALDPEIAKVINKDVIPQAKQGLRAIGRLQEILNMPLKSADPTLRAEADQLSKFVSGAMKDEIIGSGAISEAEWKILKEVIPNPTKLLSIDNSSRKLLNGLKSKIGLGVRDRLRQSGVQLEDTTNEKLIKEMRIKRPKLSKAEAIGSLKALGKFNENEDYGFEND